MCGTAAVALAATLGAVPAGATPAGGPPPAMHAAPRLDPALLEACTGDDPVVCTFDDLAPGHYDVTVMLGDRREAASTEVRAEARRLMVSEVETGVGERVRKTFTVNVRHPEGQQNWFAGRPGTPGLTLTFTGADPRVSGIGIAEAPDRAPRLFLAGDSTVTDAENPPYTGWGQRLPHHFRHGISVVNHSGSGESTISFLEDPQMWDQLDPQLRPGDVVLVQLAHNDKQTTAEQYRANLGRLVDGVRARGARPVLVTPIVRHRFRDGQLTDLGLIRTGLADLPAEMRRVATDLDVPLVDLTAMSEELVEGLGRVDSEPIYLVRVNGDRTHTSEYGATVYAGLVAGELERQGLVPARYWAED